MKIFSLRKFYKNPIVHRNKGFFMVCRYWGCVLLSWSLYAQDASEPISTQKVEEQLQDAQAEFDKAKKMFNPWYAGPLITSGAHVMQPGQYNIQPYLFLINNYGLFDKSGSSHSIPHLKTINPTLAFQFGLLHWMDSIIGVQSYSNWQNGHSATGFGDTTLSLGFGILDEGAYTPALKMVFKERFPTGKYSDLNPALGGTDGVGAGSYATSISLNVSKVVWWVLTHPINFRASLGYTFPSIAPVKGFNAYGGGYGTKGNIHTPNVLSLDAAMEYSFTQRWVLAIDAVYSYSSRTKFVGKKGLNKSGGVAACGAPFNDNLSFAPALEYNMMDGNLGFLLGSWFSVWGRNSLNFVSLVASVSYTF
jgi:hypothetical protein